jgi:hypothetical protein
MACGYDCPDGGKRARALAAISTAEEEIMSSRIIITCALGTVLSLFGTRGFAAGASPYHPGPWPIHDWRHQQPTEDELNAMHQQDVTPTEAREVDELYNQLESSSERILKEEPALEQ